jgi:hypothetical protein
MYVVCSVRISARYLRMEAIEGHQSPIREAISGHQSPIREAISGHQSPIREAIGGHQAYLGSTTRASAGRSDACSRPLRSKQSSHTCGEMAPW